MCFLWAYGFAILKLFTCIWGLNKSIKYIADTKVKAYDYWKNKLEIRKVSRLHRTQDFVITIDDDDDDEDR